MDKIKDFAKKHKKAIIITASVAGILLVGGTAVYLNRAKLAELIKTEDIEKTIVNQSKIIMESIPDYSGVKLVGEKLTPTGLGSFAGVSNQKINKMLVEKGLQERLPCGEYRLTELGKRFGEVMLKVTSYDYTFSNIEWDKSVLEILFGEGFIEQRIEFFKELNIKWERMSA